MTTRRTLAAAALLLLAEGALDCHARPRTSSHLPDATDDSEPSAEGGASIVAEIDLTAGAPEVASSGLFAGSSRTTYSHLIDVVKAATEEPQSKGILVRFGSTRLGWARAQELGGLLAAARQAKKQVVCHADGYTNTTAWVALRGCNRVWVSPAGEVATVGIAAQILYANRLLTKKLGIDVDILQVGKFKGAEEPLTRDGPSPEARASLESTLTELRRQWVAAMADSRGAGLVPLLEDGPFSPAEAKEKGLVDDVGYLDDARDDAKKLASADRCEVRFGSSSGKSDGLDLPDLVRRLGGGTKTHAPHVALVHAIGAIAMDSGGGLPGESPGITERKLSRTLRTLTEDASTRAVVLRIDSPGGSALASDLLWHKLMQLRAKKPIVVSIGDMAASGGYYMASTGNVIVAEPTSIVGSIGVVGGKLAFGSALEQFGVHVETFAPAPPSSTTSPSRGAYESPFVSWDDATRARVRASMTAVYDLFLARVASGRGVPVQRIADSAEGRIFTGTDAKERGLVDEWGGLERAIALAHELAKLPPGAPTVPTDQPSTIWDFLDVDGSDASQESRANAAAGLGRARAATQGTALAEAIEEAQSILGAGPEIPAFVGSVLPLAHGEATLTALPFAILIR